MGNSNTYIFNSSDINKRILNIELKKSLFQVGLLEELNINDDIIIEESNDNAAKKRLTISIDSQIDRIWLIKLEKNIDGITPKGSSTECALLIYKQLENVSRLDVLMIELKSTLQPPKMKGNKISLSTLNQCENKIRCTTNRIFMLLGIANKDNISKVYSNSSIYIILHTLINFNTNNNLVDDKSSLNKLYVQNKSIYTFSSIINHQEKVFVKISDLDTINLSEIINNSQQCVIRKGG